MLEINANDRYKPVCELTADMRDAIDKELKDNKQNFFYRKQARQKTVAELEGVISIKYF